MLNAATLILGGTFDPVHFGHLRAAAELYEQLQLDDFRMLPAGQPPHRGRTQASAFDRLHMLQLALQDHPGIRLDDCEIRRDGPSYMVDTLTQIRASIGTQRPLLLALGQDAANTLDQWHCWQQLPQLAHLVIMTRPDNAPGYRGELAGSLQPRIIDCIEPLWQAPAGHVLHLNITELAISSTDIRAQIEAGRDPAFLLPASVLAYIREQGLYR
jgi:nicotinate-nucleotide adenylyltransferase